MQSKATSVDEYIISLPEDRQIAINKIRKVLKKNLPKGFVECMSYGMIGFVVPHSTYPKGYHCNPKLPLPFINLASQKNFISLYHMGLYGNKKLRDWFEEEYAKQVTTKLDMGSGCMRFKKLEQIPYALLEELAKKISVEEYIMHVENTFGKKDKV